MGTITKNAFGKPISEKSDLVYGTTGSDRIDGKGGADAIYAKAGDDLVIGGSGNDLLNGGWGNDTFFFGLDHDADKVQDFERTSGNNDVIALAPSIDSYFVFAEPDGIRVVTVDVDNVEDPKQGSITLQGVTAQQWTQWGGQVGSTAFTGDMGPAGSPLIDTGFLLTA